MKTSLKTANLKEEYAETALRERAAGSGILLADDAKATDFRIQLKKKSSSLSPFTEYDVWVMEGIREINDRCEECLLLLCMTINLPVIITDVANVSHKATHGDSFRYLNFTLVRKEKDGKKYYAVK